MGIASVPPDRNNVIDWTAARLRRREAKPVPVPSDAALELMTLYPEFYLFQVWPSAPNKSDEPGAA